MISLKSLLFEIGDSSAEKYPWKLIKSSKGGTTRYEFETSAGLYDVQFAYYKNPIGDSKKVIDGPSYDWYFGVDDNYSVVTNKGEIYKIMATVMEILRHFISNIMAERVKYITFHGSKKDSEGKGASKRTNFYLNYIKQSNIGDIIQKGNEVAIMVKR